MPLPPSPPAAVAPAPAPAWSVAAERLLAADAASFAPPDFKRQLARHAKRMMQGVAESSSSERGQPSREARLLAAARGARSIAGAIRDRTPFSDVAYEVGGLVHAIARAFAAPPAPPASSRFLGFSATPFQEPEALVQEALPAGASYDAALTLATRLLAWTWKSAGGKATVVTEYPATKGPYVVR